jgi:hypothetical protein
LVNLANWLDEAEKCRREAARAPNDKERSAWLRIAEGWAVLAEESPSFAPANDPESED